LLDTGTCWLEIEFTLKPGKRRDLVDTAVKAGAQGIVTAGVANGNMPKAVMDAVARAVQKGAVVVRASRVPLVFVGGNVEGGGDKLNFVASEGAQSA
jgi:L-asparaginase